MKYIYFLATAFIILLFNGNMYGQCCAAGNPVSSNSSLTESGSNVLGITLSHLYSISDTYYNGITKLDKSYVHTGFNFTYLSLNYGLTDKMKATADLGYFINKTQDFVNDNYQKIANGLGDLNIGLSYDTYHSEDKEFTVSQSARMTFPIGVFNQVYDGFELPIDLQPSSGNYKFNLGITFLKKFGNSGFSLYSINSLELSKFIKTENTMYKYGNLYNIALLGSYQVMKELSARLQLRAEIREQALNNSATAPDLYKFIPSTGGLIGFISPQLTYNIENLAGISLQFNYPFYKNVNGEQLTNKYSVQLGISKSFDFSSGEEPGEEIKEKKAERDPALLSTKIKVSGNCDMCKARIEKTANQERYVADSEWDPETKILTVYFKDVMPDMAAIQKSLAVVGHDTEKFRADDAAYNKLPKCCLYRTK